MHRGFKTTLYNILLSCHKCAVILNLMFLKQKSGSVTYSLLPGLIEDFIIFLSLTYFPTISTNIPNVEEECKDSQVWCCKKLQSTNEWQILQDLESQTSSTDVDRVHNVPFPQEW